MPVTFINIQIKSVSEVVDSLRSNFNHLKTIYVYRGELKCSFILFLIHDNENFP